MTSTKALTKIRIKLMIILPTPLKLLLLSATTLVSLVAADSSAPPASCIQVSKLVNGRDEEDFALQTDFSAYD